MKKILYSFAFLLLILTSCSSEDKSTTPSENVSILPKTISFIYPSVFLGTNSKSTYTYNGNKVLNRVSDGSKTIFTYDGNSITKQEQFNVDKQGKETKNVEVAYQYENGKLKTRVFREDISDKYPNGQYISRTIYTYNQDGTISYIVYSIDSITQVETKESTGKLTYLNGNLIKSEIKKSSNSFSDEIRVYEYDARKNPLKNVLGFSLLLDEISDFGNNNVIRITQTGNGSSNPAVYLTTYIYNDNGYPTRQTSFTGDGKSIEYEIEYTY